MTNSYNYKLLKYRIIVLFSLCTTVDVMFSAGF